jgi:magnesium chelatase accessory protein
MPDETSNDQLLWERDGAEWPNRQFSQFVEVDGTRLHVQQMGAGPVALLLHGTGASTHSWRDFAPQLAKRFTVIAPDLPGHGFSGTPTDGTLSLPVMATMISQLMTLMNASPALAVGHSAGAAILIKMAVDGAIAPRGIVSLNGALLPLRGFAGQFFSPLAKVLVQNSFAPRLFAWRASQAGVIERLLNNTGSTIDRRGMELYARLARAPQHVSGALSMMANWDLAAFEHDLNRLTVPLLLIVGGNDRTISSADAFRVRDRLPAARIEYLRSLGHLAHEEHPEEITALVIAFFDSLERQSE